MKNLTELTGKPGMLVHHNGTGNIVWQLGEYFEDGHTIRIKCVENPDDKYYPVGFNGTCNIRNTYLAVRGLKTNKEASMLLDKEGY